MIIAVNKEGEVWIENNKIEYLNIQDEGGTSEIINKVTEKVISNINEINSIQRKEISISELTVALQCGGSDSYSGITANPSLGFASDLIVKHGGSTILSETPEIYGAEHLLIALIAVFVLLFCSIPHLSICFDLFGKS